MSSHSPDDGTKAATRKRSELGLRITSALVLIAVTLAITIAGGVAFQVFCALGALLIVYEYAGIVRGRPAAPANWPLFFALIAVLAVYFVWGAAACVVTILVMAAALAAADVFRGRKIWDAAGLGYAALPFLALVLLRGDTRIGLDAVLFLFACVWGADTFAYFAGRRLGGPKLAPAISPNKTWSGLAGGLAGAVLAGLIVLYLAGYRPAPLLAGLALILALASVAGDLLESWLKRRFGKKDSGRTIPGHGGILDRVDGLLVAAFVFWLVGIAGGAPMFAAGSAGETLLRAFQLP